MAAFVVIEGLDGAGTTTQVQLLHDHLQARGKSVVATAEPTDGMIGRAIRATMARREGSLPKGTLPWLFAADRAHHLQSVVEPALERGTNVVSDRYLPSSLAYQSLDRPLELAWSLNRWFRVPDLLIYVDVPVDVCLHRIGTRGEERDLFEEASVLRRVAARYEEVLAFLRAEGQPVVRIDGEPPPHVVADAIARAGASLWR